MQPVPSVQQTSNVPTFSCCSEGPIPLLSCSATPLAALPAHPPTILKDFHYAIKGHHQSTPGPRVTRRIEKNGVKIVPNFTERNLQLMPGQALRAPNSHALRGIFRASREPARSPSIEVLTNVPQEKMQGKCLENLIKPSFCEMLSVS